MYGEEVINNHRDPDRDLHPNIIAGARAAELAQAGADSKQLRHTAGASRGAHVCLAILSGPHLPRPPRCDVPQPARFHFLQVRALEYDGIELRPRHALAEVLPLYNFGLCALPEIHALNVTWVRNQPLVRS